MLDGSWHRQVCGVKKEGCCNRGTKVVYTPFNKDLSNLDWKDGHDGLKQVNFYAEKAEETS